MATAVIIYGTIAVDGGPPRNAVVQGVADLPRVSGGPPPYVDIGPPPEQPGIWPPPGGIHHPAHPIAPGGPPPTATPPIFYPPEIWPTPPARPPLGIWGPPSGLPTPPIYLPTPPGPGQPPIAVPPIYYPPEVWPKPPEPKPPIPPAGGNWTWYYDEELGWVLVPPGGGGRPQPVP
jgi:hypothetical protein